MPSIIELQMALYRATKGATEAFRQAARLQKITPENIDDLIEAIQNILEKLEAVRSAKNALLQRKT